MFILFLTSIGISVFLKDKIQREYDGAPGFFEQYKMRQLVKAHFETENQELDLELSKLLAEHRSLVRQSKIETDRVDDDLYIQAMQELEKDLKTDLLEQAFEELERNVKKTKKGL